MAILRNKTQGNFTLVNNSILQDKTLSLKERGLLITLISLPDNWDFSIKGLTTILPERKDALNSAINSLIKKGYLKRYRERDESGFFRNTVIEIYECPDRSGKSDLSLEEDFEENVGESEEISGFSPKTENPELVKCDAENPETENPHLDNPGSENPKLEKPETENPHLDNPESDNPKLDNPELENPKLENPPQLNTKYNKTRNKSNTYFINSSSNSDLLKESRMSVWGEVSEEEKKEYAARMKQQIDYAKRERLETPEDFALFQALYEIIIEFVCNPPKSVYVQIGNVDRPYDEVKNLFLNLSYEHVNFARNKLKEIDLSKVVAFRSYALTVLYNVAILPEICIKAMEKKNKSAKTWAESMSQEYDFEKIERILLKS